MKFFFKPVSCISFLFLFACGGGGSSSDAEIINPITPPTPNDLQNAIHQDMKKLFIAPTLD